MSYTKGKCPACKQEFSVRERLFYQLEWSRKHEGLIAVPSDRALFYHKTNGKYYISNGVKQAEGGG